MLYNYNKIPKAMSTFRYKGLFDGLNTYWANKKKLNYYKFHTNTNLIENTKLQIIIELRMKFKSKEISELM